MSRVRPAVETNDSRLMPRSKPTKPGHVVVGGRGEELLRRGDLGQLAVRAEQRHQVADLDGLLDVVGDEHDRLLQLGLQGQQLVLQGGADHRVDGAERLVHQQDRRVGGEGAGDADALLLAAGQLVRVALRQGRVEADEGDQLPGPRPAPSCAASR